MLLCWLSQQRNLLHFFRVELAVNIDFCLRGNAFQKLLISSFRCVQVRSGIQFILIGHHTGMTQTDYCVSGRERGFTRSQVQTPSSILVDQSANLAAEELPGHRLASRRIGAWGGSIERPLKST